MKDMNCREIFSKLERFILFLVGYDKSMSALGFNLFLCLPAVTYGCTTIPDRISSSETDRTYLMLSSGYDVMAGIHPVDILIFNNDEKGRLDTYQRIYNHDEDLLKVSSTSGDMLFTVLSNSRRDEYDWTEICSRENLEKVTVRLEDETEDGLFMSGECTGTAGSRIPLMLSRKCAEIRLRSVRCDFISQSYSGCRIENPRVYLINVNAEAPVIGNSKGYAMRIINTGRLDMKDLRNFKEPGIIYQELPGSIGKDAYYAGIGLLCYPNHIDVESPGTPATRLVIEGTVSGRTYYWSININPDEGGVAANCRYTYDICIRRPGTSDPDIPVELKDGEIIMEVERWKEKEEYAIRF